MTFRFILSFLLLSAVLALSLLPVSAEESTSQTFEKKETVLTGKRILFTGDSIAEAYCERNNGSRDIMFGWASRIGERNQMFWVPMAYGGASVSNCRGENTILRQLRMKQNASYDVVVLHGGVNDAWDSAPLGHLTEGFDPDEFEPSTFAGGLEATLHFAKTTFPDAILCYVINFQLPLATIGRLSNMTPYVNTTKKACEKWGVPFLDLYNDKDLNKALEVGTSTKYLPDHIHPNTGGYDILYPVIESWLTELVANAETPAVSEDPPESSETIPSEDPASGETLSEDRQESVSPPADSDSGFNPSILVGVLCGAVIPAAAVTLLKNKRRKS
ncbi:MAG: SGNH/GDSL hydrolase family protein [Clostridia bacterium]|nr:SGNH/GDSL hydrolase family protein [Clostridia bacterium]